MGFVEVARSYRENVGKFGPDDFFSVSEKIRSNGGRHLSFEESISLLKLSCYDSDVFWKERKTLMAAAADIRKRLVLSTRAGSSCACVQVKRLELLRAVHEIMDQCFCLRFDATDDNVDRAAKPSMSGNATSGEHGDASNQNHAEVAPTAATTPAAATTTTTVVDDVPLELGRTLLLLGEYTLAIAILKCSFNLRVAHQPRVTGECIVSIENDIIIEGKAIAHYLLATCYQREMHRLKRAGVAAGCERHARSSARSKPSVNAECKRLRRKARKHLQASLRLVPTFQDQGPRLATK
jgi:hypothetical protein